MLAGALRFRILVALLALVVIASCVPLYKLIKQDYIPSDVDEAEFEVIVTAPEGTSLAAMDEAMQTIGAELSVTRGVRLVLTTGGGGFLGNVNTGNAYVRIAPHEERTFSFTRLWHGVLNGDPLAAWRDNYTQRDVMQDIRRRLRKYRELRTLVRNYPSFNIGGANFEIDLMIRGPELEMLVLYGERLREQTPSMGIIDANTTLQLNKPELRVQIDRARAADLGVETDDIARALRLMVGGDDKVSPFRDPVLSEDYDVQLRLSEVYRNPSCPLEFVVTAETIGYYKEGHFQLEALGSDRMD